MKAMYVSTGLKVESSKGKRMLNVLARENCPLCRTTGVFTKVKFGHKGGTESKLCKCVRTIQLPIGFIELEVRPRA